MAIRSGARLRKPGFKSSLGGKLLLAIVVIAGFPAATGVLGWIELQDVARVQSLVVTEAIPAISEVRGVAESTSRVVALAPDLAAVTTEAQRADRTRLLLDEVDRLRDRIARHASQRENLPDGAMTAEAAVRTELLGLDRLVQQRIRLIALREDQLRTGLSAAREMTEIADTLVANAEMGTTAGISGLYDLVANTEDDRQARFEALDKLIEVDLFQLGLMTDLRTHALQTGLLLNRIGSVESQTELAALRADLEGRLTVIARRIQAVPDPRRADRALALMREIGAQTPGPPEGGGLFESASRVLELTQRITAAEANLRVAALSLDEAASDLADRIESRAVAAGTTAARAVAATRRLYALSSILALVLSFGVLWFYVRGNLIRRLDVLSSTMFRLAAGESVRVVRPKGRDEIARMEGAVEFFRQQTVANRQFEEERGRHLIELEAHRNELQRLVNEQTERLRGEVVAHDAARLRAERADRAKSEFLAMMSHEIRTAMNGVLGMLRSLSQDGLTPRQTKGLDVALASGTGLMGLLTSILDYSKLQSGQVTHEPVGFDLVPVVSDIALLMQPMAEEKGLTLRTVLPDGELPRLSGDVGKLRQILFNLLSNAVKFTATGQVVLQVEPLPALADGRVPCRFDIKDSGKGIASDALERIFAPFEQEDAETARVYGGTGLGLSISRRLAEVMGGQLSARSQRDRGSTFTFEVAFAPADASDAAAVAAAPAPMARRLSVLVVEDHPVNQEVARLFLERLGHEFRVVGRGEEAVTLTATGAFDAVLMDVNLPDISGIEATRRIRAAHDPRTARVPIIGISAHVQPEDVAACRAAGMDEILAKPVSPEDLMQSLASQCGHLVSDSVVDTLGDLGPARTQALIRLMLDRLGPETDAILSALRDCQSNERMRRAHQLKSAVGNFRMPGLVAILDRLAHRELVDPGAADLLRAEVAAKTQELAASLDALESAGISLERP